VIYIILKIAVAVKNLLSKKLSKVMKN